MPSHCLKHWGKADEKYLGEPKWHPLAYHCLDVSSVAVAWWDASPTILPPSSLLSITQTRSNLVRG